MGFKMRKKGRLEEVEKFVKKVKRTQEKARVVLKRHRRRSK